MGVTNASPGELGGDLQAALTAIAHAIADSLELKDVWDRVADACHIVAPFDALGIVRLEASGNVYAVAAAGPPEFRALQGRRYPRADFSPIFWPDQDQFLVRLDDAQQQLDRSFWTDRVVIERGYRSVLRVPVNHREQRLGSILLLSFQPSCFSEAHGRALTFIAHMVALALVHEQLAEALAVETQRSATALDRATRLEQRVHALVLELQTLSPHQAIGQSRRWRDALKHATKVAPTDTTVLLTGESGTGKEVLARFIHRASPRKEGPFVALNCAALPEQLLESELFGHERGAFTGAQTPYSGRIEQAAGGVLFLDEVAEMSSSLQAKFLRVLQEREYQRLGSARTLKADVRVLAATNRDLKAGITRGTFREDLYYRLAVFDIELPPLRERTDDIPLLVETFLEQIGRSVGRPAAGVTDDALQKLMLYAWPGNVRELRNVVERAVILSEGGLITSEHLPLSVASKAAPAMTPRETTITSKNLQTVSSAERELILRALERSGNNKSKAARLLGLTRAQLRSRIEKHGLSVEG
jgi:transcriptional regulator with GAF, ATPase, and Fis domain